MSQHEPSLISLLFIMAAHGVRTAFDAVCIAIFICSIMFIAIGLRS